MGSVIGLYPNGERRDGSNSKNPKKDRGIYIGRSLFLVLRENNRAVFFRP